MMLRPPVSTRTSTLCPYSTLFRSPARADARRAPDRDLAGAADPHRQFLLHRPWRDGRVAEGEVLALIGEVRAAPQAGDDVERLVGDGARAQIGRASCRERVCQYV